MILELRADSLRGGGACCNWKLWLQRSFYSSHLKRCNVAIHAVSNEAAQSNFVFFYNPRGGGGGGGGGG